MSVNAIMTKTLSEARRGGGMNDEHAPVLEQQKFVKRQNTAARLDSYQNKSRVRRNLDSIMSRVSTYSGIQSNQQIVFHWHPFDFCGGA